MIICRFQAPCRTFQWLAVLVFPLLSGIARSEIIHLQTDRGLTINAEYLDTTSSAPPILILHGFLQTRNFFTVRHISYALHEAGYKVLLPNLSLGINNRRQSLACEAVHNHSMQQDTNEIALWVDWLYDQTDRPVTLIGHSAGSLNLVSYLDAYPDSPVEKSLLISLIAFLQGPVAKENTTERTRAEADLILNGVRIERYRLAYCDHYATTAKDYLSYLAWDPNRTLKAISGMKVKPTIILGGGDNRLGPDWKPQLQSHQAHIIEIDGANHFFDHAYEFDLLDGIEKSL
ncbi:MAG: alpha/beta fold hydrolase [Candidatus Thiodiazotropha sp.]